LLNFYPKDGSQPLVYFRNSAS